MVGSPGKKLILSKASRKSLAKPEHQQRRLYGRRQSRPLNTQRQEAFDTLMPKLQIEVAPALDPKTLFPASKTEHWLEIGFGNGEHLTALMQTHPENGYIGVEPYINGMAAFLKDIKDEPCDNIRVLMDDAILLCENLTDECLDGIYVLNPDPWPKTRHHKRRIISRDNLDIFARILKPGAALIMSTDVDGLAEWIVTQSFTHPAFEWTAKCADDWRKTPENWIKTRYEEKGAKGSSNMSYLIFKRI